MKLHQLRYFQCLAHYLHYRKASEALYISQPTLSFAIKELEKELVVALFKKEGRTIQLSQEGKIFLDYVSKSLQILDEGIHAIQPKKEIKISSIPMTEPVGERLDELTVIELDRDLAARLQTHPFLGPKLTIYQQDAMTMNFGELSEKMGQPLRVFGNLPYNISTPLMFHLFSYTDAIADMHFMLQKEVVNRLVAGPNSKAYGRLSVMAQYFCNVIPVLEVPPTAFTPPPKVDSAVVRLVPHKIMPYPVKDLRVLSRITTEAFNQRRKTIRNSLGNLFTVEVLTELGIDPAMRAENISVEQYCKLANYISENAPPKES